MMMILVSGIVFLLTVISVMMHIYTAYIGCPPSLFCISMLIILIAILTIGSGIVREHQTKQLEYYESIVPKEQHYEYRELKLAENVQVTVEKECE